MLNVHKQIRIVKKCSLVVPRVNESIRQKSLAIHTIDTALKLDCLRGAIGWRYRDKNFMITVTVLPQVVLKRYFDHPVFRGSRIFKGKHSI